MYSTHSCTGRCSACHQSSGFHREQLCCCLYRQSHTICCMRGYGSLMNWELKAVTAKDKKLSSYKEKRSPAMPYTLGNYVIPRTHWHLSAVAALFSWNCLPDNGRNCQSYNIFKSNSELHFMTYRLLVVLLMYTKWAKRTAHGFHCNNFVYSQSIFIIFGTCTLQEIRNWMMHS